MKTNNAMNEEKVNVLLCEDDENLGMLLREYLQVKGFNVDLFPDGEQGLNAFLENKYEICVLDVMMPKKDRDEVIHELIDIQYMRNELDIERATFRVRGDLIEIYPAIGGDELIRVEFFGDEIDRISLVYILNVT